MKKVENMKKCNFYFYSLLASSIVSSIGLVYLVAYTLHVLGPKAEWAWYWKPTVGLMLFVAALDIMAAISLACSLIYKRL